jgi:hypothetical protein
MLVAALLHDGSTSLSVRAARRFDLPVLDGIRHRDETMKNNL